MGARVALEHVITMPWPSAKLRRRLADRRNRTLDTQAPLRIPPHLTVSSGWLFRIWPHAAHQAGRATCTGHSTFMHLQVAGVYTRARVTMAGPHADQEHEVTVTTGAPRSLGPSRAHAHSKTAETDVSTETQNWK